MAEVKVVVIKPLDSHDFERLFPDEIKDGRGIIVRAEYDAASQTLTVSPNRGLVSKGSCQPIAVHEATEFRERGSFNSYQTRAHRIATVAEYQAAESLGVLRGHHHRICQVIEAGKQGATERVAKWKDQEVKVRQAIFVTLTKKP